MQKTPFALALLVCLASGAPSSATEPGTPMDCSDLELAPGLTCTEVRPPLDELSFVEIDDSDVDNDGRVLSRSFRRDLDAEIVGTCGRSTLRRTPLVKAFDATGNATPLVTVTDRCVDPAARYVESAQAWGC